MNGYMGKLLRVDLSGGRIWEEPLNEEYARLFVGGSGLAARYLLDMVGPETDPLGPENPLILMTGPLVGTAMPSAGRLSVCALSPLTRIWGESNTGGFVGPELRFAGYDGIIVTGRADRPVWLSIVEGEARLHDAADLWGLDSYATQERVRELLGEPKARVLCIGPAGERGVKMAAVMNDHGRAAGRTGMGAVMGSKNLKAVALRGTAQVPLADPEGFKETVREVNAAASEDMAAEALRLAGTASYVDMALMFGDLPIRNWRLGEWEEAGNLSGVLLTDQYLNRPMACYRCPIACGRETRAPRYGLEKVDGPEYETIGALGSDADDRRPGGRHLRRAPLQRLRDGHHQRRLHHCSGLRTGGAGHPHPRRHRRPGTPLRRRGDRPPAHPHDGPPGGLRGRPGGGERSAGGTVRRPRPGRRGQPAGGADARPARLRRDGRHLRPLPARRLPHGGGHVRRGHRAGPGGGTGHPPRRPVGDDGGEGTHRGPSARPGATSTTP
jgi:hypothetical protein